MSQLFNPISKASQIKIDDSGGFYTGDDVEDALQEIGDGTTLDDRYVNVTGDTMTGDLVMSDGGFIGVNTTPTTPLDIALAGTDMLRFSRTTGTTGEWAFGVDTNGAWFIRDNETVGNPIPINIAKGAPTGAFVIQSDGDITGKGSVEMVADSPFFGWTETDASNQRWQMIGVSGQWRLRDLTNNTYPIIVEASAPTNAFRMDDTGRVGINNSSPTGKLHVVGDANIEQLIVQANTTQTDNIVEIRDSAGSDMVVVDGEGNLGINIGDPQALLHVRKTFTDPGDLNPAQDLFIISRNTSTNDANIVFLANGQSRMYFGDADSSRVGAIIYNHVSAASFPQDSMQFQVNSSKKMTIDSSGNVGFGTAFPNAQLHTTGGRIVSTTRVTTTYTILITDHNVFCDTDGGAFTVTLPAGVDGQTFRIINCGSSGNDVTIAPDGAELLTGVNSSRTLSDGSVIILTYSSVEGWW